MELVIILSYQTCDYFQISSSKLFCALRHWRHLMLNKWPNFSPAKPIVLQMLKQIL